MQIPFLKLFFHSTDKNNHKLLSLDPQLACELCIVYAPYLQFTLKTLTLSFLKQRVVTDIKPMYNWQIIAYKKNCLGKLLMQHFHRFFVSAVFNVLSSHVSFTC